MRMVLKAANTDIPIVMSKPVTEQIVTFNSFNATAPQISFDDENGDTINRSVLDNLHSPAVISRLSDSKVMYYNKKAQDKFNISNVAIVKMSDLYVNKSEYEKIVSTVLKHKEFADFETSLRSLGGKKINVSGSANMVWYKGQRCKFVSFQDITAEKTYKDMALTDSMTGIHNRLSFIKQGTAKFTRSRRYGHNMSVLLLDVDFFKKINDTHGHKAGDDALIALTDRVSKALRSVDVFGRIGGEEFSIILPETDLKAAEEIAERIRIEIKDLLVKAVETGADFGLTASIGVTALNQKDADVEDAINRADVALYEAKNNGRDKVVIVK